MRRRLRPLVRALFGNNYSRTTASSAAASFSATLLSTLVPQVYTGSSTPTFTRATTAYVTDFEGLLKQVPSGCARFTGARFVRNLCNPSQAFSGGGIWVINATGAATLSVTDNYGTDPLGGNTAARFLATATGADAAYCRAVMAMPDRVVNSIWLKSNTGSSQTINIGRGDSSAVTVTVTTAWQRFSPSATNGSFIGPAVYLSPSGGTGTTADILMAFAQCEGTAGQSNENPSEYVSAGVLSAPYHGAGVDGCKYFTTQNGNTVV